jgi:hypothetical protein
MLDFFHEDYGLWQSPRTRDCLLKWAGFRLRVDESRNPPQIILIFYPVGPLGPADGVEREAAWSKKRVAKSFRSFRFVTSSSSPT